MGLGLGDLPGTIVGVGLFEGLGLAVGLGDIDGVKVGVGLIRGLWLGLIL